MKTRILFISLISSLLMIMGCSEEQPEICYCSDIPFIDNYISNYGFSIDYLDDYIANYNWEENSDYVNLFYPRSYFIKGLVIDKIDYGLNVQIIDDLKGNMIDGSLITVWGNKGSYTNARVDILTQYAENDTLLLMLDKVYSDNSPEKAGDYCTVRCEWSDGAVLWLANGFVTGYIHSLDGEMETMLWCDLQKELTDKLLTKQIH